LPSGPDAPEVEITNIGDEVLKTVGATVGIIALSPIIIVGVVATGGGM
jgi:hypothetical protein